MGSFELAMPLELIKLKRFKREDVDKVLNVRESTAKGYIRNWSKYGVIKKFREGNNVFYEINI